MPDHIAREAEVNGDIVLLYVKFPFVPVAFSASLPSTDTTFCCEMSPPLVHVHVYIRMLKDPSKDGKETVTTCNSNLSILGCSLTVLMQLACGNFRLFLLRFRMNRETHDLYANLGEKVPARFQNSLILTKKN